MANETTLDQPTETTLPESMPADEFAGATDGLLDSVFNPTPAEGDGAQGAEPADPEATETDEADETEGDEPSAVKPTKKKPGADLVTVRNSRGQEFQVSKDIAPLIQAQMDDYKEAVRKISEQGQQLADIRKGNAAPAADPEKTKARREAALTDFDNAIWSAIDTNDGKGITAKILEINRSQFGAVFQEQAETIQSLNDKVASLETALYQGMGDTLATSNMSKALAQDLPLMGHEADAVTVDQIKPEFDKLWANANGQSAREVYLMALGKVLAQTKSAAKQKKPATRQPAESPLDFSRPSAPNRAAPRGSTTNAPSRPAPRNIGPSFSLDLI